MTRSRRELGSVLLFSVLCAAPFLSKAYCSDEPQFLAVAEQILRDPARPFSFDYNWYGRSAPMRSLMTNPPTFCYALAAALRAAGGEELPTRLLLLPFDLLAAAALYLLAARFLSRPLAPTLLVVASPAYLINMNLLMPEKAAAALGFAGLYALARGIDDRRPGWLWGSALLIGAASLCKYLGLLFAAPAVVHAAYRGMPRGRLLGYLALCAAPLSLYLLADALTQGAGLPTAWRVTTQQGVLWSYGWTHRLRSFLAFAGGLLGGAGLWAFLGSGGRRAPLYCLAAGALLFLPFWDAVSGVRAVDRLAGVLFAGAALACLRRAWDEARRPGGGRLFAAWVAAFAGLELFAYWGVLARVMLFLVPPMVFLSAARLERELSGWRLKAVYSVSVAATLGLSLALAAVDARYAAAQRAFAQRGVRAYRAEGRRVWFTGHWGLQHYMEMEGAVALDGARGGWDEVRSGDVVLRSRVNYHPLDPSRPVKCEVRVFRVDSPIPLRLLSVWGGQGGFYSNAFGFLPFSASLEPVEEFLALEVL